MTNIEQARAAFPQWTPPAHGGDCGGTLCDRCGCCCHTTTATDCAMHDAPTGAQCPGNGCGCEGMS